MGHYTKGACGGVHPGIVRIGVCCLEEWSKLSIGIWGMGVGSRWGGAGEEGSPGREVRAQGGLTEQEQEERAQQEPNLHGLCSSPGASDANTGKPASSQIFPVAWYPLWLPLNQA